MTDQAKIAVVGAGSGGKTLIRNFYSLGVLGAVCDSRREVIEKAMGTYTDVLVTDSLQSVLDNPNLSALAISGPVEMHYPMAKQALCAGKHVFLESPITLHEEDGLVLQDLARENERVLMVGNILHYHPAVIKLKELVSDGKLGKILYVYSNNLNSEKIGEKENTALSFAPHDISVILSLAGGMPEHVISTGESYLHHQVEDMTLSRLFFPSKLRAHLFVSRFHPFREQRLVVVGDKKTAVFDDMEPEDKLYIYTHQAESIGHIASQGKRAVEKVSFKKKDPLEEECRHFLNCITRGLEPDTNAGEAIRVLKVIEACRRSLENDGRSVSLGAVSDDRKRRNIFVHETAIIDPGCPVGDDTRVWHFSHVIKGSSIGKDCSIGQNVMIGPDVTIGNQVKIQNNVSVYPGVTLEDGVFCGPSMVFTNVYNPRSYIPRKDEFRPTLVREGATLGANSTIVCGHTIGRFAFVGAGAVVIDDVPDFALVAGNPAEIKGWMCRCGIRLHFEDKKATCGVCGLSYQKKGNTVFEL